MSYRLAKYKSFERLIGKIDSQEYNQNDPAYSADMMQGLNLIFSSCNVRHAHRCPDWDFLMITEYDVEYKACQSIGKIVLTEEECNARV